MTSKKNIHSKYYLPHNWDELWTVISVNPMDRDWEGFVFGARETEQ